MTARAFLGVGSNLGPEENIPAGFTLLQNTPHLTITGISTFYRTPPLPAPGRDAASVADDPDFLNGVIELLTDLSPQALSERLTAIEDTLGRDRGADKYSPRRLDLDLLIFEPRTEMTGPDDTTPWTPGARPESRAKKPEMEMTRGSLTPYPPHPDLRTRPWVALPLLELAPEIRLPPDGTPLRVVAERFSGPGGEPTADFTARLRRRFLKDPPQALR